MRLLILGPLAVEIGPQARLSGGAIRRRLLAILALERNRTVPADRIVELLWGDDAPATAPNTLQVHVSALRKALAGSGPGDLPGPDRLRTDAGGYRLVTRPNELDADAFDADVADAMRWAGLDRRRAIARLDDALALWRGDVLADVALPTDLLPAVAGLEARREAAIDLRLRLRLGGSDPRSVLPELEALLAADPANESWAGLRMVALYRGGRQADALATFQAIRRHLLDELGLDPSPSIRRLELAILRQAPELDTDEALGLVPASTRVERVGGQADRLPAELTTFVGRQAELVEIARLLDGGSRLVTIVGIGGVGKSRLALRAARAAEARFGDGAAWVDLVAATSVDQVAEGIATALGVRDQLEPPYVETLASSVRDRHVLLVVDNCEPVTAAVGHVLEPLLRAVPGLSVVATSREPLGLAAEQVLPLDGLALPPSDAADPRILRSSDAVALLLERGRSAAPRRALGEDDLGALVAIASRLDGLPLALEMAAAGLRSASPAELAGRLSNSGAALALAGSTASDRHRTLRATFESSVARLDDPERAVFRRLAAFAGAAPVGAIEVVCGDGIHAVPEVLSTLVDRSLVVPVAAGRTTRYGLLVPVREYADELLTASGERERTLERHLEWAVALARTEYAHRIPYEAGALKALNAEMDDLRAALARSVGGSPGAAPIFGLRPLGQELAGWMAWFWNVTGRRREGIPICEAALEGAAPAARAHLLRGLGYMAIYGNKPQRGAVMVREALAIWQALDEPFEQALAYSALGWSYLWPGQNDLAVSTFERGAEQADRITDPQLRPIMQAILLGDMAQALVAMRDIQRGRALGERVLREASPGDLRTLHFGHHFLGDCALLEHDPATAAVRYAQSLELAVTLDDPVETCVELEGVAIAQAGLGRHAEALRVFDATEAWLDRMGVEIHVPFWKELKAEWIGPARASLGSPDEPDGTPLGAAAAVALARSLPTTAPEPASVAQWEK